MTDLDERIEELLESRLGDPSARVLHLDERPVLADSRPDRDGAATMRELHRVAYEVRDGGAERLRIGQYRPGAFGGQRDALRVRVDLAVDGDVAKQVTERHVGEIGLAQLEEAHVDERVVDQRRDARQAAVERTESPRLS